MRLIARLARSRSGGAAAELARSRSGGAAAELALMAPVLGSMLFVAMDLGSAFNTKLELEQAAQRALEMGIAPGTTGTSYTYLGPEATAAYGKPVVSSVATNWLECAGVKQASWGMICPAGQTYARYVNVVIKANYTPRFSFGGLLSGNGMNGAWVLTGDATVRIQ
ncbi:pilus assembly protein [Sandarakinorhabdus sp.]|uniref:TadE/TadG family type IV pilus assembly protein n=1 Tax=Sandarakinorhabdus sp. TaxID=1916663 RepID=UPI00286DD06C|nr:pilus assembly protein [Sandarakinorhabdus sp.]